MTLRGLYRFLKWTLQPDVATDRPPAQHRFRCVGEAEDGTPCGAEGPASETFEDAQSWAFVHIDGHQDHRSYEHAYSAPWVVVPADEPN
ncbi:hypothetical protein ACFVHB_30200 [Kitasatospora sp. NPDC127111]|uniref:DUF7848 domain-containing protein n=1 Tax=Kitasatospora sp. NPDC127111 TaxID=3345363 RepID=UPI00363F0A68